MDWSATLSLKTSRAKQHRPNYGSFASSLSRHGSGGSINIPESIPENHSVVQFTPPKLRFEELRLAEVYGVDTFSNGHGHNGNGTNGTATMTVTETSNKRTTTFKMLLSNGDKQNSMQEEANSIHSVARAAGDDHGSSNYWVQERERLRQKRERWRLLGWTGSPTKASLLGNDKANGQPGWKTGAIMCSVPLLLVLLFVIFVSIYGDRADLATEETSNAVNTFRNLRTSTQQLQQQPRLRATPTTTT
ncbi:hypothetical protein Poli38472_011357 [Pythium oligandrum]|uniref:Uncharacterized protein n=1 Tax=Pythium oligandrum TaxID=41045 RepID=A0A8K1CJ97_PYTOL|nr:hypothetical protein Poli38472_011357 [Pythium oligandrum]|eukprot:TMW64477.1 hypothetical protein Poli38472_011357 [Pythium oligandrum]